MHTREISVGQNTLRFETGKLAKQAHGSVIVRLGDSVVLVTACHSANPREGIDFLPLTVDYREYTYASGRIPGGFFKREGKPAEKEVLTSRMIDRPTRPLFPAGWRFETQIIALVLSADQENDTDVLAITGASVALALSDIPFQKTIAAVRMGLVDGQYIVNPTFQQRKESKLDLIVVGSKDGLVMVEAGAKEVTEEQVVTALDTAHAAIKQIVAVIDDLAKEAGKKKLTVAKKEIAADFYSEIEGKVFEPLADGDAHPREARELRDRRLRLKKDLRRQLPDDRSRAEGRRQGDLQGAEGKGPARRGADPRRPPRRPQVRRDPHDLDRDRRAAAHARLGRVHARRDAGARHLHARHRRRCAEDRELRGRDVEELHAPLQLPAVLGRRNRPHDRPGPPRNRPRRAGGALADAR